MSPAHLLLILIAGFTVYALLARLDFGGWFMAVALLVVLAAMLGLSEARMRAVGVW